MCVRGKFDTLQDDKMSSFFATLRQDAALLTKIIETVRPLNLTAIL